jgi:hypothetical protein
MSVTAVKASVGHYHPYALDREPALRRPSPAEPPFRGHPQRGRAGLAATPRGQTWG